MSESIKVEVDLGENAIYLVKDGKIETLEGPPNGYGKQTILWQNFKPVNIEVNYTKKI